MVKGSLQYVQELGKNRLRKTMLEFLQLQILRRTNLQQNRTRFSSGVFAHRQPARIPGHYTANQVSVRGRACVCVCLCALRWHTQHTYQHALTSPRQCWALSPINYILISQCGRGTGEQAELVNWLLSFLPEVMIEFLLFFSTYASCLLASHRSERSRQFLTPVLFVCVIESQGSSPGAAQWSCCPLNNMALNGTSI